MLTFMLHITVKEGCEAEAVETLTAIENEAHKDHGCLNFSWLQHEQEPHRFTLFEQWESQDDLDAHLNRDTSRWERFVPCLVGEPRSESFYSVNTLGGPPKEEDVKDFVRIWFDRLSRHVAVEELLPMLEDDGLEMVFPEVTLKSKREFTQWYAKVGQAFDDQVHVLEKLDVQLMPSAAAIHLDVVWKTRLTSDGSHKAYHAQQAWRMRRSPVTRRLVIVNYQVQSFDEIPL